VNAHHSKESEQADWLSGLYGGSFE